MTIREGRVHANGLEFAYLEAGDGPLALFLHGFPPPRRRRWVLVVSRGGRLWLRRWEAGAGGVRRDRQPFRAGRSVRPGARRGRRRSAAVAGGGAPGGAGLLPARSAGVLRDALPR